jgi:hypothetical protein
MQWDPFSTLRNALWIGGAQWAGKSTVAGIVTGRHGLTHYHYDYHDARGHQDRRIARQWRRGETPADPDPETSWVTSTPRQMADAALAAFAERFPWVQDDLRALISPHPVVVDGWGLRPDLVAPVLDDPRRMVVLVPTPEFHRHQLRELPRAGRFPVQVSDPGRAQRNRVERDRLLAEDVVRRAHEHDIRVIEVDGTRDAAGVAGLVAEQFHPYLERSSH